MSRYLDVGARAAGPPGAFSPAANAGLQQWELIQYSTCLHLMQ